MNAEYDGETFDPDRDKDRLDREMGRVKALMSDGEWRTLQAIADVTHDGLPGISARLRDLRKVKFGAHTVERRYLSDGIWEYRLALRTEPIPELQLTVQW